MVSRNMLIHNNILLSKPNEIGLTNLLIGRKRYAAFPPKEKPAQAGASEER
jgi:hypothetical protein